MMPSIKEAGIPSFQETSRLLRIFAATAGSGCTSENPVTDDAEDQHLRKGDRQKPKLVLFAQVFPHQADLGVVGHDTAHQKDKNIPECDGLPVKLEGQWRRPL